MDYNEQSLYYLVVKGIKCRAGQAAAVGAAAVVLLYAAALGIRRGERTRSL